MIRRIFFFLILLFFTVVSYSQQKFKDICSIERNIVQDSKEEYTLYLSFRISFEDLIFSKEDAGFKSGVEFFCEVFDKDKLIERKSISKAVSVQQYENTASKTDFIQAFLKFKLYNSVFTIKPSIQRANTNFTFPLKEFQIDLLNNAKKARPVIVKSITGGNDYALVNLENSVPYDVNQYSIFIPVPDSIPDYKIILLQKAVTLKDTAISKTANSTLEFSENKDLLLVKTVPKALSGCTYVKIDLPKSVDEGDLQINLEYGKKRIIYNLPVIWMDRPFILMDLDLSIRLMKLITNETVVNNLLKQPDELKYSLLKEEWNKITKSGNNGINPLMKEFYTRADYAMFNFSFNGKRNGTESDRGKIYLRLGKPSSIDRNYNEKNDIIEIWKYDEIKRDFIFEDTSGNGNFILRN